MPTVVGASLAPSSENKMNELKLRTKILSLALPPRGWYFLAASLGAICCAFWGRACAKRNSMQRYNALKISTPFLGLTPKTNLPEESNRVRFSHGQQSLNASAMPWSTPGQTLVNCASNFSRTRFHLGSLIFLLADRPQTTTRESAPFSWVPLAIPGLKASAHFFAFFVSGWRDSRSSNLLY